MAPINKTTPLSEGICTWKLEASLRFLFTKWYNFTINPWWCEIQRQKP